MSAVVLLPAYTLPFDEDAHLTLVYAGDEAGEAVNLILRMRAEMLSRQHKAFVARVMGMDLFGTNHDEPVLLVQQTMEIALMRSALVQFNKSEYTEFRPHVAVPHFRKRPDWLYFNQIALWPDREGRTNEQAWWLSK